MSKREEYTQKLKSELDTLNAKMDALEAKTQEAKADAREAYKAEVAKLRHQSRLAVAKYEELKAASEDTWDKMVAETEKIRDAFVHSFNYFKSQI
ncbi:MAG: hypothetical protein M3Q12_05370 [Pseudomonadota bacterium]|uniref:hypothetical protein n=1 Tax=Polaromonas sp. TaxID=1869339 RepID=UPI0017BD3FA4|nr:hypothetical protein [Polaromonas sp.]MBA3592440.1 hypothetical protein [Polaromonas sp.]MDQ3271585.1 hypothetical protein [Pseudomonadota bacterium]